MNERSKNRIYSGDDIHMLTRNCLRKRKEVKRRGSVASNGYYTMNLLIDIDFHA